MSKFEFILYLEKKVCLIFDDFFFLPNQSSKKLKLILVK